MRFFILVIVIRGRSNNQTLSFLSQSQQDQKLVSKIKIQNKIDPKMQGEIQIKEYVKYDV